MDDNKILAPFRVSEKEQLSLIYSVLEARPVNNVKPVSEVSSPIHQTNNYPLFEHYKPISKIVDFDYLKDEKK